MTAAVRKCVIAAAVKHLAVVITTTPMEELEDY